MHAVAAAAAVRAHGTLHFLATAAVAAATAAVVVVPIAVVLFLATHALGLAVTATGRVVKKEHMFSPPLFYVREGAEVSTLSVYAEK